jgi:hypothetical protein
LIELKPEKKLAIARRLLEAMGEDTVAMSQFGHSAGEKVLTEIAKAEPSGVWGIASAMLGPPIDNRAYSIGEWLKGEADVFGDGQADSILKYVPAEELWRWVDTDVVKRAWYLASFVPKDLFISNEKRCLAREVLIRYGDREDVQSNLAANFSTEGWVGPESTHHEGKKKALQEFLAIETHPRVRDWLTNYISSLDRTIGRARIEEERED